MKKPVRWVPAVGIVLVVGAALIVGLLVTSDDEPAQQEVVAGAGGGPDPSSGPEPTAEGTGEFHPDRFVPDPETGRIDWENLPERVPIYTPLSPTERGWVEAKAIHGLSNEPDVVYPIYVELDGDEVVGYISSGGVRYDRDKNVIEQPPVTTVME